MLIFMGMSGKVFFSNQFVFVLILAGFFFFFSPLCLRNVDSEGGGGDYLDF